MDGASSSNGKTRIAPDLKKVLSATAASQKLLAVVYQLKGEEGMTVPPADRVDELVQNILKAAEKTSKSVPQKYNVFRNLGSFVVLGDPSLHRAMIKQPEIGAAVLNRSPSS